MQTGDREANRISADMADVLPLFRAGMGVLVNTEKPLFGRVCVYLRGGERHVTQEFLDCEEIRARLHEMGSECMAQSVG